MPEHLRTGLALPQLPALDGVRAIAAFLVVFYHFGLQGSPGGLGVLVFFVLSGFLITWLLLKENEQFGGVSLRDFYIRRALRIFPAFYCYAVLAIIALVFFNRRIIVGEVASALLYVNDYYAAIRGNAGTPFSHTWSLGIEEQFYLVWPLLFLTLRHDSKKMASVLAGIILALWAYRETLIIGFSVPQGYIYSAFDTRVDHLMIGCLLAVVLRAQLFPSAWRLLCGVPALSVVTAGLIVLTSVAEYLHGAAFRDTVSFVVHPVLVALLIPQLIAFRASPLWGWLNWPAIRFLGRISYSVYLYQQVAMEPAKILLASYPLPIRLSVAVGAVILAATGSYFLVERPFLRLKARFQHKKPAVRTQLLRTDRAHTPATSMQGL